MLTNTSPVALTSANTTEVTTRTPARVRVGVIGLAAVLVAVMLITLTPQQVDAGKEGAIAWILSLLQSAGVPSSFGYRELEFTANIVMFVPLGFFVGLLVSRRSRWVAFALPLLLSTFVEVVQFTLLPLRVASVADVIANTAGGWIGATIALTARWVFASRA